MMRVFTQRFGGDAVEALYVEQRFDQATFMQFDHAGGDTAETKPGFDFVAHHFVGHETGDR